MSISTCTYIHIKLFPMYFTHTQFCSSFFNAHVLYVLVNILMYVYTCIYIHKCTYMYFHRALSSRLVYEVHGKETILYRFVPEYVRIYTYVHTYYVHIHILIYIHMFMYTIIVMVYYYTVYLYFAGLIFCFY